MRNQEKIKRNQPKNRPASEASDAKSLSEIEAFASGASDARKAWPSAKKQSRSVRTRNDSHRLEISRNDSHGNASDARVLGQLALLVGESHDNSQEVSRRVAGG